MYAYTCTCIVQFIRVNCIALSLYFVFVYFFVSFFVPVLTELREAMAQQDSVRLGLQRAADNLIGQVSGPNASHVRQKVEEIGEKWGELTSAVETRSSGEL